MGKQKKKQKKRGNPLWTLVFLAALAVFCFSGYKLIGIYLDYKTGTDEYRDLQQYTTEITKTPETPATTKTEEPQAESEPAEPSEPEPEPLSYPTEPPLAVDFESLKAINPDVKGWLYIEALDISYPVVQGPDNDAYLHTTYSLTRNVRSRTNLLPHSGFSKPSCPCSIRLLRQCSHNHLFQTALSVGDAVFLSMSDDQSLHLCIFCRTSLMYVPFVICFITQFQ